VSRCGRKREGRKKRRTGVDLVLIRLFHKDIARPHMNAHRENGRKRENGGIVGDEVESGRFRLEEVLGNAGEGGGGLKTQSRDSLLEVRVLEGTVDHATVGEELREKSVSQSVS
jgi:hypothetical protein